MPGWKGHHVSAKEGSGKDGRAGTGDHHHPRDPRDNHNGPSSQATCLSAEIWAEVRVAQVQEAWGHGSKRWVEVSASTQACGQLSTTDPLPSRALGRKAERCASQAADTRGSPMVAWIPGLEIFN